VSGTPAVFLDRDGVLNVYLPGDYVRSPDDLTLLPGAAPGVRALNELGFPLFVISNQQGVAKGLMTPGELTLVDNTLHERLRAEGALIEKSYYCPHHSRDNCDCRKPKPGLLLRAAEENGIDLSRSYFIGDTETDGMAAGAAGVGAFILVLTGKYTDSRDIVIEGFPVLPNYFADDLPDAVNWIKERESVQNG